MNPLFYVFQAQWHITGIFGVNYLARKIANFIIISFEELKGRVKKYNDVLVYNSSIEKIALELRALFGQRCKKTTPGPGLEVNSEEFLSLNPYLGNKIY